MSNSTVKKCKEGECSNDARLVSNYCYFHSRVHQPDPFAIPEPPMVTESPLTSQVGGDHYRKLAIQPVEYIHKNDLGFLEGNVVKYITRHSTKNGAEDILKAIHYCQLLLDLQYGRNHKDMHKV